MALTQRLQMRQSQALVMTPQLMQAIKLLQLSNLDLVAYVEGELERNPLLERTGEGPADATQPGEANPTGLAEITSEAPGEWTKSDVNGSAAIEDSFDTPETASRQDDGLLLRCTAKGLIQSGIRNRSNRGSSLIASEHRAAEQKSRTNKQ